MSNMRWIWIDRFEEFHSGKSATAIKMVSRAEDHLYEQTPLYPVMPHSLILEGLAQTGGILLGEANDFKEKVVLAKITSASFFDHAVPGDELRYIAKLVDIRTEGGLAECQVLKNGTLMAQAEIFFAHVDQSRSQEMALPQENFVFGQGHLSEMIKKARAMTPRDSIDTTTT
jgi:3-hydroxyacyl-[acyl-carrier-protein] dehydratase